MLIDSDDEEEIGVVAKTSIFMRRGRFKEKLRVFRSYSASD